MISFLLTYLLKLSITLVILYFFYRLVLRPLTFYQWNRFYLLIYSLLAFIIPFVNIASLINSDGIPQHQLIKIVPTLNDYNVLSGNNTALQTAGNAAEKWGIADILTILFLAGFFTMLIRVLLQYASLWRIRQKAVLLTSNEEIKVFETTVEGNPFSFGRSIYINRSQHTEEELQRMVAHEMVHVKQKHTVDLLVGEWLCIVNWFNPFAWLIRNAIRQNLEFIADNQVLVNHGVNKKEYQYLLLKVAGAPAYGIAHHFNFSHLKKRIAMMNKLKSAKAHLLKFLFVLPLLVVLLLAFRKQQEQTDRVVWLAGLVVDAGNMQPINEAKIYCKEKNITVVTDSRGYYEIKIPYENRPLRFVLEVSKEGYGSITQTENWGNFYEEHIRKKYQYSATLFALQKGEGSGFSVLAGNVLEKDALNYEYAVSQLPILKENIENDKENGEETLAVPSAAVITLLPEPNALPGHIKNISINSSIDAGRKINIQEATVIFKNGKKEKYDLADPTQKTVFEKKYGAYSPLPPVPPAAVVEVAPAIAHVSPAPATAPVAVEEVVEVAAAPQPDNTIEIREPINPASITKPGWPSGLKKVNIHYNTVELLFKNGSREYYDFNKPEEKNSYEKKYGKMPIPMPPPPPPAAPSSPKAPKSPDVSMLNNKGYKITVADDNGECVVIVKKPDNKIVKAILMTEWNAKASYYNALYGEIPPPPTISVAPVASKT